MWIIKHYDLGTGHVEIVAGATSRKAAEGVLSYLVEQDHATDAVYYIDEEESTWFLDQAVRKVE